MVKAPYLKNFPVFEDLNCEQARALGQAVVDQRFEAKHLIFAADQKAEYLYLIREGHVKLYRQTEDGRENVITILGPGDVFGELVFCEDTCHSVFAEAFGPVWLCILPRHHFLRLLLEEPALALAVLHKMGQRLAQTAYFIEHLSTYDLTLRLGKLLLQLAEEYGVDHHGATRIKIRLTHQDLANMIATSRQTVTTLMNRFKKQGLIGYEGPTILVNHALLSAFVEQVQAAKT